MPAPRLTKVKGCDETFLLQGGRVAARWICREPAANPVRREMAGETAAWAVE